MVSDGTAKDEAEEKVSVKFEVTNARFSVLMRNKTRGVIGQKDIVRGISVTVKGGEVCAVMGPSGAGKTTLLDLITLKMSSGVQTGEVSVNGLPFTGQVFRDFCAYVPQFDLGWAFLTCREAMLYAASFNGKKAGEVDSLIKHMGLEVCQNIRVGNEFIKGLSGGQNRRLSLAVALLKDPSVVFLDEVTTGLDSTSAANVMNFLCEVAKGRNIAIFCTIHQPASTVFANFDKLLLLSGGLTAYYGPASAAVEHFEELGVRMQTNTNPADFLLDEVNADFRDPHLVDAVVNGWAGSAAHMKMLRAGSSCHTSLMTPPRSLGFCGQVKTLTGRQLLLALRDPTHYLCRAAAVAFCNIIFSIVWIKARDRDQDQVVARVWFVIWNIGIPLMTSILPAFVMNIEYKVVQKEVRNGFYRPLAYTTALSLVQIPFTFFISACCISLGGYAIYGFSPESYLKVWLMHALMLFGNDSMAHFFGAFFSHPLMSAVSIVCMWFTGFLFGGVLVPQPDIVWPFRIFCWMLPLGYMVPTFVYEEFIVAEFNGAQACTGSCRMPFDCPGDPEYLSCFGRTGDEVLSSVHELFDCIDNKDRYGEYMLAMGIIALFWKLIYVVVVLYFCRDGKPLAPAIAADATDQSQATRTSVFAPPISSTPLPQDNSTNDEETMRTHKVVLSVKDARFTVKTKKTGVKQILDGITAEVRSGEVCAIMGPSGAGKTTLLDLIALEGSAGERTGIVKLNGSRVTYKVFQKYCTYVPQFDRGWAFLTCEQTVRYAAAMYGRKESDANHLIQRMGLDGCRRTKVGNEFLKGLSGGQKRRLSLACALLKDPLVVFLDEVTSGLDAAAAAKIMTFLVHVAKEHAIVIMCTIHQPSTTVFANFDKLLLLSGGRTAYFGPADKALPFFESTGRPSPPNMNPADFMLDLVNADFTDKAQVDEILAHWKNDLHRRSLSRSMTVIDEQSVEGVHVSLFTQFLFVLKRQCVLTICDPMLYTSRIVGNFAMCMFFAIIYVESRDRIQSQVLNRAWLLLWHVGVPAMMPLCVTFVQNIEIQVVRLESKCGMYHARVFFLAQLFVQIPMMFVISFCCICVSGYAIANWDPSVMPQIILVHGIFLLCMDCMAQFCSVLAQNPLICLLGYIGIWFLCFLFSGFMISTDSIVWPLRAFSYVNPIRYTSRVLIYIEFSDTEFSGAEACVGSSCARDYYCPTDPNTCFGRTGGEVLTSLNTMFRHLTNEDTVWNDVMVMLAQAVLFKTLYFALAVYWLKVGKPVTEITDLPEVVTPVPEVVGAQEPLTTAVA